MTVENKPCRFPFTYHNKTWNSKTINIERCIESPYPHENVYGPICPTSNPHGDWLEEGTYGFCQRKSCKIMPGNYCYQT